MTEIPIASSPEDASTAPAVPGQTNSAAPKLALSLVSLTAIVCLISSHFYLLNGDDLLELWGDSASSLAQLVHIQTTFPMEIDPFFYHLLTFLGLRSFGQNAEILRLPGIAGFLTMQVCLFYYIRRIAPENTALFALLLPALTSAIDYTHYLRPYGLLLGLFALCMVCWQACAHRDSRRTVPLIVLAITLGVSINTHYFGVLLLVPVVVAEIVRSMQNRRIDKSLAAAIVAGSSAAIFVIPFLKGAMTFRTHYAGGGVRYNIIPQTYNSILFGTQVYTPLVNRLLEVLLLAVGVLVVWSCYHQFRERTLAITAAELAFILALASLPLVAFLIGRYGTHGMEARYALGSVIGICALISLSIAPLFRRPFWGTMLVLVLLIAFACKASAGLIQERAIKIESAASLTVSPAVMTRVMNSPSQTLYIQDIDVFGFAFANHADPFVLSHLALVYSPSEEMRWNSTDLGAKLALHLQQIHPYPIVSYESVASQPGEHIFVISHGGWNWIDEAFQGEHRTMSPVGTAFGLDAVSVRFDDSVSHPR